MTRLQPIQTKQTMSQLEFASRRYLQFGTVYTVEFCIDIKNHIIWLNENSFSEVVGHIPSYRQATDSRLTSVLGDRNGSWFPISTIPAEHLKRLKPDWTRQWLEETLDLLERFYLEVKDYGNPDYQLAFEFTKLWEGN